MLRIWINAFIPADISGVTRGVPQNPGKTMIDGPPGYGCFLTDQRGFSGDPGASARIHAGGSINSSLKFTSERSVGTTHQVDCESGRKRDEAVASTESISISHQSPLEHLLQIKISAAVSNPLTPPGSPDIDFNTDIRINYAMGKIKLAGMVEPFPAFEAYVIHEGRTFTLFQRPPDPGASPLWLYGPPNKSVSGNITYRNW
jgi:hypothetical protein